MRTLDEQKLNSFLTELLNEARSAILPQTLSLVATEKLPQSVDAQLTEDENGDLTLILRDETIDDYTLSHELLHMIAKKTIPSFVKVLHTDMISIIAGELQGYLEHNWILNEQRKRGLEVDTFSLWDDLQATIGSDQAGIENFRRILIINNIIRTFPEVFERNYEFLKTNAPNALALAEKIMAHYPPKDVLSDFEARRATVRAINEWKKIFTEVGLNPDHLTYQISVIPVFSQNQLDRVTDLALGIIPNAFTSDDEKNVYHVVYTKNDNQCSIIFQADEEQVQLITGDMTGLILREFLKRFPLSYLTR